MPWISRVDPGQPLNAQRKVLVCIGPIHHPPAVPPRATGGEPKTAMKLRPVIIFDANEMEFSGGPERRVLLFIRSLKPAKPLAQAHRSDQEQACQHRANPHRTAFHLDHYSHTTVDPTDLIQ